MSAMLRDASAQPTGIPVQLSKNWHNRVTDVPYWGMWFHGFSQVRLAPGSKVELELTICYGHWGGVAAASHAQLSLVGWGSNQLWDQSAAGSWGESICYEPDQAQAECLITDVRPLMVSSVSDNQPWGWTHNVGGGDFFRFFDPAGHRVFPTRMRTVREKQGPCLTAVTYAGKLGEGIEHRATASLARTNAELRDALATDGNTWRMIHREAVGNDRRIEMTTGELTASHPAITIRAKENAAEFTLAGGLGYVPVTISGLATPGGPC